MTPSCSSISYFPSAQTRNSRNGPTAAFPEDSIPAHAGKTTPTRRPWCGSSAHPRSRGENQQRLDLGAESRGSSPLTRGKPDPVDSATHVWRLIPAHAGKTGVPDPRPARGRAHPRSRGENGRAVVGHRCRYGSSPLTRGKRRWAGGVPSVCGLIPAHAGKTYRRCRRWSMPWAHPRSRGENDYTTPSTVALSGSSPLTRGKQVGKLFDARPRRLIPAHAGKTSLEEHGDKVHAAHPRSRGENRSGGMPRAAASGSSPLTRGKRSIREDERTMTGLIPAHAGKTSRRADRAGQSRAHPRSRGENCSRTRSASALAGSSPLTRGKHRPWRRSRRSGRLIPAHAGKTGHLHRREIVDAAHPRSRGENLLAGIRSRPPTGSSPLTRGKPRHGRNRSSPPRLIPAHAGKTLRVLESAANRTAHPRSRGENLKCGCLGVAVLGSSPLTRGKPEASGRHSMPIGLIPAHAGKTQCLTAA